MSLHGARALPPLTRGLLVSVGARALDLPCRYGFHLLIAAGLGVVDAGRFYIVFSAMVALAGLGRLGLDRALTRQVAAARATGRPAELRAAIRSAFRQIFIASALVALLMAALAHPIALTILGKPDLALPLALGALSIPPQNLGAAVAGALAGLQRIAQSQMIYSWLWPALFCLSALVCGTGFPDVLWQIAGSFTVAALIGGLLLRHGLGTVFGDERRVPPPPLLRPGLSLFTLELTQLMIASAPALILGMAADNREVGLFSLSWRIALLINIVTSGVTGMAAPKFAELNALGDRDGLGRTARQAIRLSVGLSLLPAIAMISVPGPLLSLFGAGYEGGAATLRILALGQIVAACTTSMPDLLGMTGHTRALRRINGFSLIVLLALTALLTPVFGAPGAAAATALTIAVNGGAALVMASRLTGIRPWRAAPPPPSKEIMS